MKIVVGLVDLRPQELGLWAAVRDKVKTSIIDSLSDAADNMVDFHLRYEIIVKLAKEAV